MREKYPALVILRAEPGIWQCHSSQDWLLFVFTIIFNLRLRKRRAAKLANPEV